jgi:hypothetical protein
MKTNPLRSAPVSLATIMADDGSHHHRHHSSDASRVPVPHGPETGDDYASYPASRNEENEKQIFQYLLKPDDSYTPEGIYWADLPLGKRAAYVASVDAQEASKELRTIGSMVKKDPLSPLAWYFHHAILPGAGLGLEGYVK